MQVISEDHYTTEVVYAGRVQLHARKGRNALRLPDRAHARRSGESRRSEGSERAAGPAQGRARERRQTELPNWDQVSQDKVRGALSTLAALRGSDTDTMFGAKNEVDPIAHLIGTAIGWAATRVRRRSTEASIRRKTMERRA